MSKAYSFIRELRRRKVFRGAAIYLIAAYGILEVADVIAEPAGLPAWTLTVLFYGALIGFPLAVFLGWRYEFGEHGLVLTKPVSSDETPVEPIGWRDYLAIGLLTSHVNEVFVHIILCNFRVVLLLVQEFFDVILLFIRQILDLVQQRLLSDQSF